MVKKLSRKKSHNIGYIYSLPVTPRIEVKKKKKKKTRDAFQTNGRKNNKPILSQRGNQTHKTQRRQ